MKRILVSLLLMLSLMLSFACSDRGEPITDRTASSTEAAPPPVSKTEKEDIPVTYKTVQNPVFSSGADPWVIEKDGKYYYCFSGSNGATGGVRVAEIPSPALITTNGASQVYTAPAGTAYSQEYWAPELHYLDGAWYIYVAADDGNNDNHRMYVLKGTTQDPTDPFEMVGKITDSTDKWAIDGTVVTIKGEHYFVWSGWEGDVNVSQNLYIAHMSGPTQIDSERVLLSEPKGAWETVGSPTVNEGPAALYHEDSVFIAFSASGSWTDNYCIGLLEFRGGDPLKRASWDKSASSLFKKVDGTAYGPGHCSFTTALDGSVWMIYHANLVSGSGWGGRSVWIAPIRFRENGRPIFGKPQREVDFPFPVQ